MPLLRKVRFSNEMARLRNHGNQNPRFLELLAEGSLSGKEGHELHWMVHQLLLEGERVARGGQARLEGVSGTQRQTDVDSFNDDINRVVNLARGVAAARRKEIRARFREPLERFFFQRLLRGSNDVVKGNALGSIATALQQRTLGCRLN